jgi:hypothetical protein
MNKALLNKAVKKEIISNDQAIQLIDFFNSEKENKLDQTSPENKAYFNPVSNTNSGEQLKFLRSFGDIFIALGILLLTFTSNQLANTTMYQLITIVAFFLIAEWLVGYKRLVLPGISILLSLLFFVNKVMDTNFSEYSIPIISQSADIFAMILVSLIFYLRYKMPFSLYPVAVGCIYLSIDLSGINVIDYPYIFIILGLIVFTFAMWYDSRDTERVTSLSDNAFWLHLLAAPLIVHGIMVSLFLSKTNFLEINTLTILLLLLLFFLVALFVDRRAILVSSFVYALYSIFKFAYEQFFQVNNLTLLIFMGTGLFIIFLGTYWYHIRKFIFSPIASLNICKLVPKFEI